VTSFLGLLRSEVLRLSSRRLFRFLVALAVLGVLIAAVVVGVRSSKDPDSGVAEARRELALCERESARHAQLPDEGTFRCPSEEEFRDMFDRRFHYASTIVDVSRGVAFPLFALSLLVGASFVGAEWGSGTMSTLLTWEPRRGRVLVAKVVACAVLLALSVAVFLAFVAVVFFLVAALRGVTDGTTSSMWWTLSGIWARGAGLAVFSGTLGAALATLTRSTAGGVGAGLVYGMLADPLLGQWRQGRYRPWLLQHLVPRLIGLPVDAPRSGSTRGPFGESFLEPMQLSPVRPIVLLSIYAVALTAIAYASFRARDVT
jgi:hypothetical protein